MLNQCGRNMLRDGRGMLLERMAGSEVHCVDAVIIARALVRARKRIACDLIDPGTEGSMSGVCELPDVSEKEEGRNKGARS